jgi:hypothetical protein
LARRDGVSGIVKFFSGLHLDENQIVLVRDNKINFTGAGSQSLRQNIVTPVSPVIGDSGFGVAPTSFSEMA